MCLGVGAAKAGVAWAAAPMAGVAWAVASVVGPVAAGKWSRDSGRYIRYIRYRDIRQNPHL